jgi:hypothetical protein
MRANTTGTGGAIILKVLGHQESANDISPWRFSVAPMMDWTVPK